MLQQFLIYILHLVQLYTQLKLIPNRQAQGRGLQRNALILEHEPEEAAERHHLQQPLFVILLALNDANPSVYYALHYLLLSLLQEKLVSRPSPHFFTQSFNPFFKSSIDAVCSRFVLKLVSKYYQSVRPEGILVQDCESAHLQMP